MIHNMLVHYLTSIINILGSVGAVLRTSMQPNQKLHDGFSYSSISNDSPDLTVSARKLFDKQLPPPDKQIVRNIGTSGCVIFSGLG